jgi:hypothetical protein
LNGPTNISPLADLVTLAMSDEYDFFPTKSKRNKIQIKKKRDSKVDCVARKEN